MKAEDKIHVLFFSHSVDLGGAELSLLLLLSGINKAVFEPIVVVPKLGPLAKEIENLGIVVEIVPVKRWIPYRHAWGVRDLREQFSALKSRVRTISKLIQQYHIDIVYTNTVTMLDGALMSLFKSRPHIWHAREYLKGNDDIKPYLPYACIPSIMGLLSNRIIVNSHSLREHLCSFFTRSKLTVVYNSVDLEEFLNFKPDDNSIRVELGLRPESQIVVYIGNLSERKDLITFIKAAKLIKEKCKRSVFILVGEGHNLYKDKLKRMINECGLTGSFHFLGKRKDIPRIMYSIDLLILPSRQEAFGKVIIEAMAMQKPVVATLSGGPEEIVLNEQTGFLIPVADENMMAEKAISLLLDPSLSQKFGSAGRQRVLACFDYKSYITGIERVIKHVYQEAVPK